MSLYDGLFDEWVVARSPSAGVFLGQLKGWEGATVRLERARKAHQWHGAGAVQGLATVGPVSGRITDEIAVQIVHEVCEIVKVTDKARKAWDKVPVWDGRK